MTRSNFIVRGGFDAGGIRRGLQDTQRQLNGFQRATERSMAGVGKAIKLGLGYMSIRALTGFVKATTSIASDLTEVQNVVDTVFGSMATDINDFAKISIEQFGLSELSAKKYSSTMGAMLKSSGIAGEGVRDMALDLTKLSADMASFYNLDNDAAFQKIMSGMSGMTMPLKELGINMNIANLEAYALSEGMNKAYRNMSQAEQTMIRYNYLLSVTGDAQGDFAKNIHTWANQTKILSQQWAILKGTIGGGFINMLMPIVTGFNVLIKKIQVAAEYFKAFTALIFGDSNKGGSGGAVVEAMGDSLGDTEDGLDGVGKAGKKAGKDLKGALAGFDEINTLADKASGGAGDLADELGGIGGVDLGKASGGELDIDTSKMESKLSNLKGLFKDIYINWGMKDLFQGFRDGLELINFDNIKTSFTIAFSGLGEITNTALLALQPIWQATGETFGTLFKNGIAIVGNIFEPISLGFANFIENMKGPIQDWIIETSQTITNGYNNLTTVFEIIGQSWLNSITKYKDTISTEVENIFTNIANTFMLFWTIISDTFKIITNGLKEFVSENKEEIQLFTDSILGIFTDVWGLINNIWTDALNSIKQFWDTWGKDIVTGVMGFVNDIGGWILYLWNDLVKPTWDTMMEWLTKIWNENLKGIVDELLGFVGRVGDLIVKLWDGILQPLIDKILKVLVPAFKNAFNYVLDIVGSTINGIGGLIKNLLKILNGIIDFVVGVFTGDWKKAWEGISNVFKGIVDGLVSIFKIPLNWIISGINTFVRGINNISIPDWVPVVGGKGFNIKEIPHLAKGAITNGPMMAVIGDNPGGKEVVSPLDDLMGMIASAVGSAMLGAMQMSSSNNENREVIIELDGTRLGRAILPKLDKESERLGYKSILQLE